MLQLGILWFGALVIFIAYGFNPGDSAQKEEDWRIALPIWAIGAAVLLGLATFSHLKTHNQSSYRRITVISLAWPLVLVFTLLLF